MRSITTIKRQSVTTRTEEADLFIKTARDFSRHAHKDQKRKYTGEPYFNHCQEVADLVEQYGWHHHHNVAAAYLHDVVEDCSVSLGEIYNAFGKEVFERVFWLTDVSKGCDGNREIRKSIDRMHILGSRSLAVYVIKCADLISNTQSIQQHDPDFAKIYLKEKRDLLMGMASNMPLIVHEPIYKAALKLI